MKRKHQDGDRRKKRLCMWKKVLLSVKHGKWMTPVNFFKNAPFGTNWEELACPNMVIELPSQISNSESPHVNWVGTIQGFAGYKALVKYNPAPCTDTPEDDSKSIFAWIPFCSSVPMPLGYSFTKNYLLHPPSEKVQGSAELTSVIDRTFKAILFKEGNPVSTLKFNHIELVKKELARCSSRFIIGEIVEAIDKNDISVYRLGQVADKIGDRVRVLYIDEDHTDLGFWFGSQSQHVHKLGWCDAVGAPLQYGKSGNVMFPKDSLFSELNMPDSPGLQLEEEMIFEMRHPVLTFKICAAYVVKVLKYGYFVAGTDWTREDELVEIILHVSSDYILPLGFSQRNKIPILPPKDAFVKPKPKTGTAQDNLSQFSWKNYLRKTKLKELDVTSIQKGPNKFVKGCKLEAVLVSTPTPIRPATVVQVAGRLVKIHFDGRDRTADDSYQWVSCDSSNIYPVGYAEMVGAPYKDKAEAPRLFDHLKVGK